eukprot:m.105151 g.105151  ORF g.105151 m.105151 type:complete len:436 (+) comp14193_c0_seq4:19-1326(+)
MAASSIETFSVDGDGHGGRTLFSAKILKAGTSVLTALPLATAVSTPMCCDTCWAVGSARKCLQCKLVSYCGAACQKAAWPKHKKECALLAKALPREVPPSALLLIRLCMNEEGGLANPLLAEMQGHQEQTSSEFKESAASILMIVAAVLGEATPPAAALMETICKVRVNSFGICDGEQQPIGAGLYPRLHLANHSCRPNCMVLFTRGRAELRTTRTIAAGTPLTVSYIDALTPTHLRRAELQSRYLFDCLCPACTVPDTLMAVRCSCGGTASPDTSGVLVHSEPICASPITAAPPLPAPSAPDASERTLEQALRELTTLFAPTHMAVLTTTRSLLERLLAEGKWAKATQYCARIVEIMDALSLHNSPLLGIELYKLGKLRALCDGQERLAFEALSRALEILTITHGGSHELCKSIQEKKEELFIASQMIAARSRP